MPIAVVAARVVAITGPLSAMISMAIVSRAGIPIVIRERVPAVRVPVAISEREVELEKGYECRTPPTPITLKLTAGTPGPVTVVIDPAAVVIRRPTPRLISHPGPAVRRTPDPMAVTIWRPIAVST